MTALRWDDQETAKSLPSPCLAGQADKTPPQIVVISPPTSAPADQPVWIKARLLDNREYAASAGDTVLPPVGRKGLDGSADESAGEGGFCRGHSRPGDRGGGAEYYIEASDGDNTSAFPSGAAVRPLSLVVEKVPAGGERPGAATVAVKSRTLSWPAVPQAALYRIYRSSQNSFHIGPDNFLTYVAGDASLSFTDNGEDLLGQPLKGTWHYRVTAVDRNGFEGVSSAASCHRVVMRNNPNSGDHTMMRRIGAMMVSRSDALRMCAVLLLIGAAAWAGNPIIENKGVCDPQMRVFGDRVWLYATHDRSVENKGFCMLDWWVWSSADLVNWTLESTLRPQDTYFKNPSTTCWATDAATRNGKYYFYFSMGRQDIGVVVGDTPRGLEIFPGQGDGPAHSHARGGTRSGHPDG